MGKMNNNELLFAIFLVFVFCLMFIFVVLMFTLKKDKQDEIQYCFGRDICVTISKEEKWLKK